MRIRFCRSSRLGIILLLDLLIRVTQIIGSRLKFQTPYFQAGWINSSQFVGVDRGHLLRLKLRIKESMRCTSDMDFMKAIGSNYKRM